jgi:hypothetical protein
MYYVYRTTCLLNGKFYIGKHKTENINDGYIGSGKLLLKAVSEYGKDNFVTEILSCHKTDQQASLAERILIVRDREISYNLHEGGNGGWDYLHSIGNHGGKRMRPILFICKHCKKNVLQRKAVKAKEITRLFCSKQCAGIYSSLNSPNHVSRVLNKQKHREGLLAWWATNPSFNKEAKSNRMKIAHKQNPKMWVTNDLFNVMAFEKDLKLFSLLGFRKGRIFGLKTIKQNFVLHSANGRPLDSQSRNSGS